MARKKSKNAQQEVDVVTWAQAFRDIIISSMERGQMPILLAFGAFFLLIWKLESADSLTLINLILDKLSDWYMYGYVLFILSIIGWYGTSRSLHKMHFEECDRVGREKTELQEKLLSVASS